MAKGSNTRFALVKAKRSIRWCGLKTNIDRLALPLQHRWVDLTVVQIRKSRA